MVQHGSSNDIQQTSERLLAELLDRVEHSQREMTPLDLEMVRSECLAALSAAADGGPTALLLPTTADRLELAEISPPGPAAFKRLRVATRPDDSPSQQAGAVAASVRAALGYEPDQDAFVQPMLDGERVAAVVCQLPPADTIFDAGQKEALSRLTATAGQLLRASQRFAELLQHASIDPLSGLYNQRYFSARLSAELSRAARHGHLLGLLLFGIDGFDHQGPAASHMLRRVGGLLRATGNEPGAHFSFRRSDVPVRHSGQAFAVLLPETPKWGVLTKAERLRQAVSELTPPAGSGLERLSASIGGAVFPTDGADATALLAAAAGAMQHAREAGGDRVEPA